MKKVFFLSILASLLVLSGCKKDDDESPVVPPTGSAKGVVKAHFEASGLAGDVISVKVFVNDEQKITLTESVNDFVLTDIDIANMVRVVFEPVFADIEAPTEKFDFVYDFSYNVGVSDDGGKSWKSVKHDGSSRTTLGYNPNSFEDYMERLKSEFQKAEVIIENGEVLE